MYVCAPPFIFCRTSFNPRIRASPLPDRNDSPTLPYTNRNPNIFTVIPSLRFPLPLTQFLLLATAASLHPKPFSLDAAVTRAIEVEESQYMCPSSRQADCETTLTGGNSQTINKQVQTDKLTLAGVELISPGQCFCQ